MCTSPKCCSHCGFLLLYDMPLNPMNHRLCCLLYTVWSFSRSTTYARISWILSRISWIFSRISWIPWIQRRFTGCTDLWLVKASLWCRMHCHSSKLSTFHQVKSILFGLLSHRVQSHQRWTNRAVLNIVHRYAAVLIMNWRERFNNSLYFACDSLESLFESLESSLESLESSHESFESFESHPDILGWTFLYWPASAIYLISIQRMPRYKGGLYFNNQINNNMNNSRHFPYHQRFLHRFR